MDIDITCLEASGYISDSVDGRLDPKFDGPLRSHLSRCGLCRFELSLVQGAKASTPETPEARPGSHGAPAQGTR